MEKEQIKNELIDIRDVLITLNSKVKWYMATLSIYILLIIGCGISIPMMFYGGRVDILITWVFLIVGTRMRVMNNALTESDIRLVDDTMSRHDELISQLMSIELENKDML